MSKIHRWAHSVTFFFFFYYSALISRFHLPLTLAECQLAIHGKPWRDAKNHVLWHPRWLRKRRVQWLGLRIMGAHSSQYTLCLHPRLTCEAPRAAVHKHTHTQTHANGWTPWRLFVQGRASAGGTTVMKGVYSGRLHFTVTHWVHTHNHGGMQMVEVGVGVRGGALTKAQFEQSPIINTD